MRILGMVSYAHCEQKKQPSVQFEKSYRLVVEVVVGVEVGGGGGDVGKWQIVEERKNQGFIQRK